MIAVLSMYSRQAYRACSGTTCCQIVWALLPGSERPCIRLLGNRVLHVVQCQLRDLVSPTPVVLVAKAGVISIELDETRRRIDARPDARAVTLDSASVSLRNSFPHGARAQPTRCGARVDTTYSDNATDTRS